MKLTPIPVPTWPGLGWVAEFAGGSDQVTVYHGPMVEVSQEWVVEAVWAGDFVSGDFDRTDLVFGTGVHCRGDRVHFVSSGSTLDRLCSCSTGAGFHVANSLPALLSVAGLSLCDDYPHYGDDIRTICKGLRGYKRSLPAEGADVSLTYFDNLLYDGRALREVPKPDSAPPFDTFGDYYAFLERTADLIAANMRAPSRRHPVEPLTTISSGYDSVAASVLARRAGCREAVTIRGSTSLWRGSDSGAEVAKCLGLACRSYPRTASCYPLEESIWAVAGRPGIVNWTLFEYPQPLCLFFTGCHGDKIWDRSNQAMADPFVIASVADLGIGEFRLFAGVFHCPVPQWGMRHLAEVRALGFQEDMEPWTLHNRYDRPVARRIAEEQGVPRKAFGMLKRMTAHEADFPWPYSPESRSRFARYLRQRHIKPPSAAWLWLARRLCALDGFVRRNVTRRLGFDLGLRRRLQHPGCSLIFQWANHELKKQYEHGLQELGRNTQRTQPQHELKP